MTTTQVMIPDPVQKLFRGHTNWVFSVAISSDKKWIVSGSEDCTIKVWNVKTEECMRTLEGHRNRVYSVVFSPDGKWIVSGSDDCSIKIWNGETGECVRTFHHMRTAISCLTFSHYGQYLLCDTFQKLEGYDEKNESVLEKSRFSLFDFRRPNLGTMHPIEAILSAI